MKTLVERDEVQSGPNSKASPRVAGANVKRGGGKLLHSGPVVS